MLFERGTVVAVGTEVVRVSSIRKSTCGSCSARSGCGQNLLNRLLGNTPTVEAVMPPDLRGQISVGDQVEIGIADNAIVTASLCSYGIPILLLVIAVAICENLFPNWTAAAALAGLVFGIIAARLFLRVFYRADQFVPLVIAKIPVVMNDSAVHAHQV